jgi:hypothetical protein
VFICFGRLNAFSEPMPDGFRMMCGTIGSTINVWASRGKVKMHLEDSGGHDNFPIYSGNVTPSMLPLVERAAKDLEAFDGSVQIEWDLSKCSYDTKRPLLISCMGKGEITVPEGVALTGTSLTTFTSHLEGMNLESDTLAIDTGLDTIGDENYNHTYLHFLFNQTSCVQKSTQASN